jgi:hypothetical protein
MINNFSIAEVQFSSFYSNSGICLSLPMQFLILYGELLLKAVLN